jgi:cysteine synthase
MRVFEKQTVIRLNGAALAVIKEANELMEEIAKDLQELNETDEEYAMYDLADNTSAYLSDFLDAYKEYVRDNS